MVKKSKIEILSDYPKERPEGVEPFFRKDEQLEIWSIEKDGSLGDGKKSFIKDALASVLDTYRKYSKPFQFGPAKPSIPAKLKKNVDSDLTKMARSTLTENQSLNVGHFLVVGTEKQTDKFESPYSLVFLSQVRIGYASSLINMNNLASINEAAEAGVSSKRSVNKEIIRDSILFHEAAHSAMALDDFARKNKRQITSDNAFDDMSIKHIPPSISSSIKAAMITTAHENHADIQSFIHVLKRNVLDKNDASDQIAGVREMTHLVEDMKNTRNLFFLKNFGAQKAYDDHDTDDSMDQLLAMVKNKISKEGGLNALRGQFKTNEDIFDFSTKMAFGNIASNINKFADSKMESIEHYSKLKLDEIQENRVNYLNIEAGYGASSPQMKSFLKGLKDESMIDCASIPDIYLTRCGILKNRLLSLSQARDQLHISLGASYEPMKEGIPLWNQMVQENKQRYAANIGTRQEMVGVLSSLKIDDATKPGVKYQI